MTIAPVLMLSDTITTNKKTLGSYIVTVKEVIRAYTALMNMKLMRLPVYTVWLAENIVFSIIKQTGGFFHETEF